MHLVCAVIQPTIRTSADSMPHLFDETKLRIYFEEDEGEIWVETLKYESENHTYIIGSPSIIFDADVIQRYPLIIDYSDEGTSQCRLNAKNDAGEFPNMTAWDRLNKAVFAGICAAQLLELDKYKEFKKLYLLKHGLL